MSECLYDHLFAQLFQKSGRRQEVILGEHSIPNKDQVDPLRKFP